MNPPIRYRNRPSILTTATYLLRQGALEVHPDSGRPHAIPLERVESVTMSQFGGRVTCTVEARGHRRITLHSSEYRSLGQFGNRARDFGPFVRELHDQLDPYRARIAFTQGSPGLHAFLKGCGVVAVMMLVALSFGVIAKGELPSHTVLLRVLAGVAALVALGIPLCRMAAPSKYDPAQLPFGFAGIPELPDTPPAPMPLG